MTSTKQAMTGSEKVILDYIKEMHGDTILADAYCREQLITAYKTVFNER